MYTDTTHPHSLDCVCVCMCACVCVCMRAYVCVCAEAAALTHVVFPLPVGPIMAFRPDNMTPLKQEQSTMLTIAVGQRQSCAQLNHKDKYMYMYAVYPGLRP